MSLINQVLQNVEKRQGGVAAAETPWAAQIKPVLNGGDKAPNHYMMWLLLLAVLAVLLWRSSAWVSTVQHLYGRLFHPATATAQTNAASSDHMVSWDGRPQLSRTLSSGWQQSKAKKAIEKQTVVTDNQSATAKLVQQKASAPLKLEAKPDSKPLAANAVTNDTDPLTAAVTLHALALEPPSAETNKAKNTANANSFNKDSVVKSVKPEQEVNLLIQRAMDHAQKGRTQEAIAVLRQALNQYPQSEDARELLASYLFESQQDQEAVALLQTGIANNPGQASLRKALATWQLAHAQPEAALTTLKPMLKGAMQDAEWQWMMAMGYQQSAQHAFALPYFEKALTLRPGQAHWSVAYAMSLQALGQNAEALKQLQMAQNLPMSERMADFVQQRIQQLASGN